ncbi:hypothetical protein CSOJ01_04029 [Colletotrichum sojae]|uniref:Uncharacterized protein n=1 Tax=Colletotrichum sojae TaxID=2175907 RepID=A0A8H6JKV6_9PEZI|nr:hypothetical protein CSOJ01_04029 [Colletotrichum sojae]
MQEDTEEGCVERLEASGGADAAQPHEQAYGVSILCPPLSAQRRMPPFTPVYNHRHYPVDEIKQRKARPVDNSRRKAPKPVDVNFPEHHPYPATGAGKKEGTGQYLDSVVDGRRATGDQFPSPAGPLALWEKNEIRRSVAAVQVC